MQVICLLPPAFRRMREGNVLTGVCLFSGGIVGGGGKEGVPPGQVPGPVPGGPTHPSPITGPVLSPVPGPAWELPHRQERSTTPGQEGGTPPPHPQDRIGGTPLQDRTVDFGGHSIYFI